MSGYNPTTARPARTAVQGTVAFALTEILDSFGLVEMNERQYGAVLLLLTIILSWAQTLAERALGKGLLRKPEALD